MNAYVGLSDRRRWIVMAGAVLVFMAGFLALGVRAASAAAPVRIAAPTPESLAAGSPLRVTVRTATKGSRFRARLDGRDVTRRFSRRGKVRTAALPRVAPGLRHLTVRVRVRGRKRYAHARVVVRGKRRPMIRLANATAGVLRHADDPGVERLAFRTPPGAIVRARLNGRRVRLARPLARNQRRLVLSRSDGLRRGANALRIVAFFDDGRYDKLRRTITVGPSVAMAAAGKDRVVGERDVVSLNARASDAVPAGARLTYAWRIVQSPPGSRARIANPSRSRTRLRVGQAGRYVAAVTITEHLPGGRTRRSTDLLGIDALADAPAIGARLDTMASDPSGTTAGSGVLVDGRWTASGKPAGKTLRWSAGPAAGQARAYAFDPQYLRFMGNSGTVLSASDPDGSLGTFLAGLAPGAIVVVVGADGCCSRSNELPPSGPFSYVWSYDGAGTKNFGSAGTWNKGHPLGDGYGDPGPAGGITGYLRLDVGSAGGGQALAAAPAHFRFVQDDRLSFSTDAADQPTLGPADGATYRLRAAGGGALDVAGDADAHGPLTTRAMSDARGQQWQLQRVYGAYYRIVNARSGLCVNLSGADFKTVLQWECSPSVKNPLNELWMPVKPDGKDFYVLRSAFAAQFPGIGDANGDMAITIDGSSVVGRPEDDTSYAGQGFTFELAPGAYVVGATDSGKVLGEPDFLGTAGTQLVAGANASAAVRQWQVLDGPGATVTLRSVGSGLCADSSGGSVTRRPCDAGAATQRWTVDADSGGISFAQGNVVLTRRDDKLVVDSDEYTGQRWRLRRLAQEPVPGGTHAVLSAGVPGRMLDATSTVYDGSGAKIVLASGASGAATQQWQLQDAGNGLVQLVSRADGTCLVQYYVYTDRDAAHVTHAGCRSITNDFNATWKFTRNPDGTATLTETDQRGRVLTAAANGALTLAADTGAATQRWIFGGRPLTFAAGGRRYATSVPQGASGFAVLAFDAAARPLTPRPQVYVTAGVGGDPNAAATLGALLKGYGSRPGTTVLLQSFGRPKPNSAGWNTLGDGIAAIGGDRSTFLQLDGSGDFALAGCDGCENTPAFDERIRRQVEPAIAGARLEGMLTRDRTSHYTPSGATSSQLDATFGDLAASAPVAWPYDDGGEGTRALTWIADNLRNWSQTCATDIGPVRNGYCPKNVGDAVQWDTFVQDLGTLKYPSGADFSSGMFDQVVKQLRNEFQDVAAVHDLISGVQTSYGWAADSGASGAAIADVIATDLGGFKEPGHSALGGVLGVIRESLGLAVQVAPLLAAEQQPQLGEGPDPFELIDGALGTSSAIADLAGDNDDGSTGVSIDDLRTTAAGYGAALDKQMLDVAANLSVVEDLIVSDPARLALAAANTSAGWNLKGNAATSLRQDLEHGATRSLWAQLLPAAYQIWQYPMVPSDMKLTDLQCFNNYVYTVDEPPEAIIIKAESVDANGNLSGWKTWAFTPIGSTDVEKNVPRDFQASVLQALMGDPDVKNSHNGGIAPAELPSMASFGMLDYDDMTGRQNCHLRNRTTGNWRAFAY